MLCPNVYKMNDEGVAEGSKCEIEDSDIKKKSFFSLNIKNNKKKKYKVNKEIGFIAHVKGNIFILGLQGELRIQDIKTNFKDFLM